MPPADAIPAPERPADKKPAQRTRPGAAKKEPRRRADGVGGVALLGVDLEQGPVVDERLDGRVVQVGVGGVDGVPGVGAHAGRARQEGLDVVAPGEPVAAGNFDLTLIVGTHCPPDRFPGKITRPVSPPARASAYRCGEAWSTLVHHRPTGRQMLIVGSAGFVPGALTGQRADVVYLGVGQLGLQPETYLVDYWTQTVRTVGARRVVLIHWDDFFRPLDKPLRALPFAGDDLDASMRVLTRLASDDGVAVHMPTLWQPADPWS